MGEEAELSDVTGTARHSSEQFQMPGKCSVTGKMACSILENSKNSFPWVKKNNIYFQALEKLFPSRPPPPHCVYGEEAVMLHSVPDSRKTHALSGSISRQEDAAVGNTFLWRLIPLWWTVMSSNAHKKCLGAYSRQLHRKAFPPFTEAVENTFKEKSQKHQKHAVSELGLSCLLNTWKCTDP